MIISKKCSVFMFFVVFLTTIVLVMLIQRLTLNGAIHSWSGIQKHLERNKNNKQKCEIWQFLQKSQSYENPLIKLNPNLFVYPDLVEGPNNQIKALIPAIYLAIRLNRTFVLPVFKAHRTYPGHLNPYQMVDVDRICEFISCLSLEELRNTCNNKFDVVFESQAPTRISMSYIKQLETITKMDIYHFLFAKVSAVKTEATQQIKRRRIPLFPEQKYLENLNNNKLTSNSSKLRILYNSTHPCAVAVTMLQQPLNVKLYKRAIMPLESEAALHLDTVPDNRLFSAAIDAIRLLPCITSAALAYVENVLSNKNYAAVHWRYNPNDWLKSVCGGNRKEIGWKKVVCENIKKIKPHHFAQAIATELQNILEINPVTQNLIPVYRAKPPILDMFRNNVYDELVKSNFNKTVMTPKRNLTSFLYKNYHQCWEEAGWEIIEEIESLCEMEIMVHSTWFFYFVQPHGRTMYEFVAPLLKFLWNADSI